MTFAECRRAVLEENALARGSEAARKKVFQELKGRYILDVQHPCLPPSGSSGSGAPQTTSAP